MNIQLLVKNQIDISQLVTRLEWMTELEGTAGRLSFQYIFDGNSKIEEGDLVQLSLDGVGVFKGYVFVREIGEGANNKNDKSEGVINADGTTKNRYGDVIKVTCYDQLKYFKNEEIRRIIVNQTASEVFSSICNDFKLTYKVIHPSTWKIGQMLCETRTLYKTIDDTLSQTMINTNEWYYVRDNFGVLEFRDLSKDTIDLMIGDGSLVKGFNYKSSIEEMANEVVALISDKEGKGSTLVYAQNDVESAKKYGILRKIMSFDGKSNDVRKDTKRSKNTTQVNYNDAQIKNQVKLTLQLLNKPRKTLSVDCLGDIRVRAGTSLYMGISDLQVEGVQTQRVIIKDCTHYIENNYHTMTLGVMFDERPSESTERPQA